MANQAIALQARAPQTDFLGRAIQQNAQMMNMMSQQRAAERQAAQAQQAMEIARAEEGRKAELHGPAMDKARSEATAAGIKTGLDFSNFVYTGLSNAADPAQAMQIAQRIGQQPQFQEELFQGALADAMSTMPQGPAEFGVWKEEILARTMDGAKRLQRKLIEQNLGTSTRIISVPEYGRGPATVLEGSEAAVTVKPIGMNVEGVGPGVLDPETDIFYPATMGTPGGYTPPRGPMSEPRGAPGAPAAGSADVVYGFGKFAQPPKPLTTMTVGEVQNFQKNDLIPATRGKVGAGPDKGTGAVGTYQITYGTLQKYAPRVLGPNWRNTPFTADVQDRIAKAIYEDVKGGNLKDTWAGLPSNRPGAYSNVPWEQVRGQIAAAESGGGGAPPGRGSAGAPAPRGAPGEPPRTIEEEKKLRAFKKLLPTLGYDPDTGEDIVSPLIEASTSGGLEMIGSDIVGFATGEATAGREALGKLKALAANLTFDKLDGKLGAQISNADVQLVANTMADIANGSIPANERLVMWRDTVLPILLRGAGIEPKKPAAAKGADASIPTLTPEQVRANPKIKRWRTTDGRIMTRP